MISAWFTRYEVVICCLEMNLLFLSRKCTKALDVPSKQTIID